VTRGSLRALGITGVAVGALCLVLGAATGSLRLLLFGGVALAAGSFRLVRAADLPPDPAQAVPDADDPRWRPSDRPQIAGKKCAECGTKITSSVEAEPCATCNEPTHLRCLKDHAAHAHPPHDAPAGPFR
jgi:hypothetical protein